uniref:Transposase 1 n=1 Tax=Vibrio parahaemolyticus TaxID=670 RepID=A0A076JA80_VIBPH|nr:transposase 1 [Vibrio parahaemolyticus]
MKHYGLVCLFSELSNKARTLNSSLRHGSFAAFWLHNNKGRLTRGCNPTSSKFIHTWLRFGEIMRGSLSALPPIPIIYYADNNLV